MIKTNDKLGLKLFPSKSILIRDLTVLNKGTYWIQGPTLEKIEERLEEEIELSERAKKLYEDICNVKVSFGAGKYHFKFNDYPSRPWMVRNTHDYHRFTAMVEQDTPTEYSTPHRFMAVVATEWLKDRGYEVTLGRNASLITNPDGQAEISFGKLAVTPRPHQEDNLAMAYERDYRIVIADAAGLGKCLHKDTMIIQSNGKLMKISKLFDKEKSKPIINEENEVLKECKNIEILSYNGKTIIPKKVKHVYREKINAPTITIKTRSGKKITSTLPHKFFVFRPNGCKWIKAKDLTTDDRIALTNSMQFDKSNHENLERIDLAISKEDHLKRMVNDASSFHFDKIKTITINEPKKQYVYDLYVPETNNFLSGLGILCHNTITAGMILYALNKDNRAKRILWVVPNSQLTEQIKGEMEDKFGTEVHVITGETHGRDERLGMKKARRRKVRDGATEYEKHGFICTNWALFSKDFAKDDKYTKHVHFDAVVLDEVHRCKEGNLSYRASLKVVAPIRIALTGTAMPNGKYEELFDVLNIIDPPAAPSKNYFKRMYYKYIDKQRQKFEEKNKDGKKKLRFNEESAKKKAERRTGKVALKYMIPKVAYHSKDDVSDNLPKIVESRIHINFTKDDKFVFDTYRDMLGGLIDELKKFPDVRNMSEVMKNEYYSVRATMGMIYQDLRRFCAFGSSAVSYRVDKYGEGEKYVYEILRDLFPRHIRDLEKTVRKARESPKNEKIIEFIRKNTGTNKFVIFCTEIKPNKKLVFDLKRYNIDAKLIMGKSNKLSDEEAEKLQQPKSFDNDDVQEVLDWFWMPWTAISDFLIAQRNKNNLHEVVADQGEIKNFFYTSLALQLPRKKGSIISIFLKSVEDADPFIEEINRDGFYKASVCEDGSISLRYNEEKKRVLVTTDKLQEGINLQDAGCMIFYDYPFSIRAREQRMSRVWRDGSSHDQISIIYAMNGIEYKIERKLREKYASSGELGYVDPSPVSMGELFRMM